ncbi:hypothetical protein [Gaoshiqia sp. Z1-71]|uniref:hypothetical protein n=1 Tax=Gaoshiqia hydrogeniformans TaxID=3290090 RepID=UPI003BF81747
MSNAFFERAEVKLSPSGGTGRGLPDNQVQDPTNSQSYNRYSYCLNNPLRYTDPSGWTSKDEEEEKKKVEDEYAQMYAEWYGRQVGADGLTNEQWLSLGSAGYRSPEYAQFLAESQAQMAATREYITAQENQYYQKFIQPFDNAGLPGILLPDVVVTGKPGNWHVDPITLGMAWNAVDDYQFGGNASKSRWNDVANLFGKYNAGYIADKNSSQLFPKQSFSKNKLVARYMVEGVGLWVLGMVNSGAGTVTGGLAITVQGQEHLVEMKYENYVQNGQGMGMYVINIDAPGAIPRAMLFNAVDGSSIGWYHTTVNGAPTMPYHIYLKFLRELNNVQ